jgi:hypothetical protein
MFKWKTLKCIIVVEPDVVCFGLCRAKLGHGTVPLSQNPKP